jgi:lysophospholipase L1-like esterase
MTIKTKYTDPSNSGKIPVRIIVFVHRQLGATIISSQPIGAMLLQILKSWSGVILRSVLVGIIAVHLATCGNIVEFYLSKLMTKLFKTLFFILQMHMIFAQQTNKPIKYLALGDSYTIGESVAEGERWPNQLVDSLTGRGWHIDKPTIIATTGWRTDNLRNAMTIAKLKNEYDLVSLLIGVNNQYQGKSSKEYTIEFEELLKTAIQLAKGKKDRVFVVSIPDYGFTPYGKPKQEAITRAIDEFNEINARITNKHGVQYFDITEISRDGLKDGSLVAADGLHPSGKMYSYWAELIVKDLEVK